MLVAHGAWRSGHRIPGLDPLPRSRTLEMLTVDDHAGIAVLGPGKHPHAALEVVSMTKVFRRSRAAYAATLGLSEHPGKRFTAEPCVTVLGAELEGDAGLVGAPRAKRLMLAGIVAAFGGGGQLRRAVLRQLVGQWTYVGCFVRSAMSFFERIYSLLEVGESDDAMVRIEPDMVVELLAIWLASPQSWRPGC